MIQNYENQRLEALQSLGILDSGQDDRFDRLVRIAQRLFKVPVVRISFINEDRVWFKAKVGIEAQSAPRKIAICSVVIQEPDTMVVPDLSQDPRFADSPQVHGKPFFKFYAGTQVRVGPDLAVGTFCLMDYAPNYHFSAEDKEMLEEFSAMVSEELVRYRTLRSLQPINYENKDQLSVAEERFFLAAETSSDAIWDWNINTGLHFFSPQFNVLTGYSTAQLSSLGLQAWNQLLDHQSLLKFLPLIEELSRGERSAFQIEAQLLTSDGEANSVILSARAEQVLNTASPRLIMSVRDITPIRKLQDQLRKSIKVDAMAQYNAGLAHECNNIAAVMTAQADLVNAGIVDNDLILRSLASSEQKLRRVVTRLRALSHNLQYTDTRISADEYIREYISRLDRLLPPSVDVRAEIGQNLGSISIDYWLIDNALTSIVFNAIESSNQGHIEIRANQIELEVGGISGLSAGRFLMISVEDHGCGMSPEVLAQVFEPFFSTKGEAPPRGMGLAVASSTIERAGGKIQIDSAEGQGTTVNIYLPQSDNEDATRRFYSQ